jgi:hypothetical protein
LQLVRFGQTFLFFDGLISFFANLGGGGGYAWMIGAALGALIHLGISNKK